MPWCARLFSWLTHTTGCQVASMRCAEWTPAPFDAMMCVAIFSYLTYNETGHGFVEKDASMRSASNSFDLSHRGPEKISQTCTTTHRNPDVVVSVKKNYNVFC